MGISEAKKYIRELHERQKDPYLWPDYLTGLPDKAAILHKLDQVLPKLGKFSVAFVRIANIQPYLIKYGPDRHADIIQWAAAILKTTADGCRNGFAGTLGTHDFMVICESDDMQELMAVASGMFDRRIKEYYSKDDLTRQATLTYKKNGGHDIKRGLMQLIYVIADRKLPLRKSDLILHMAKVCDRLEASSERSALMTEDMVH
jgi:GGDEF domain-containing protein